VNGTVKGSPAEQAGLYYQDLVLAIDGVSVKALSAGEAIFRLRGAPGSDVRLTIMRAKAKEPVEVALRRQVMPVQKEDGSSSGIN
jgi:carboxyl-terminal processing protease